MTKTKNIRVGTRPVPADGFYEWKKVIGGQIPYSIGMKDDSPFVLAGLWEGWKDPATDEWLRRVQSSREGRMTLCEDPCLR